MALAEVAEAETEKSHLLQYLSHFVMNFLDSTCFSQQNHRRILVFLKFSDRKILF